MSKYKAKFSVLFFTEFMVFICRGSQTANLPPWITSVFESEYYLPLSHSSPLILHCKAHNGIVSYQWFKDNVKLQSNDRVVVKSGEITFGNLKKEDFGTYHCIANNQFGASVSMFVNLNKAAMAVFSGGANNTVTCEISKHCKIPCSNRSDCQPTSDCTFDWKIGETTKKSVILDRNITIDSEGNLHFLNINRSYEKHDLSCGIWNEKLRRFTKGSSYTLLINDNNEKVFPKAIWRSNPKARIGDNASLQCIFSGSPVPNIHWLSKNGSVINPSSKFKIKENGRQLLILNVTFDDDGVYACVDENNLTMSPYLNVTSPPFFVNVGNPFMMKLIHLARREYIEIRCDAISAPNESEPVVIQWMRNGRSINNDPLYWFSEEKKNLYIGKNVPISETGDCFTCVIENSEGRGVANFILTSEHRDNLVQKERVDYVVIAVCFVALVTVGVIIVIKKVFCKTDVNYAPEEVAEVEEEPVYSDHIIELSEPLYNLCCDEEVPCDTPQMKATNNDPDTNYNALRECMFEQTDRNFYDCAENVSGIYINSRRCRGNAEMIK